MGGRRITPDSTVLLTGASSGLGRALAARIAPRVRRLIVVARRRERLDEIARELGPGVVPIALDLAAPDPARRVATALDESGVSADEIDVLINNVGAGAFGPFLDGAIDRLRVMQDLNLRAPMELIHWLGARMRERGRGTIVNVASVAAFSPGPLMSEYYADKAWMRILGLSLDGELTGSGVRVVTVYPGPFESEFHGGAGIDSRRLGALPSADRIAQRVVRAIDRGRREAPIGLGSWAWAILGPRLPWRISRLVIHALQRRRR